MSLIALVLSVVAFACRDATAPNLFGGHPRQSSLDASGSVIVSPGNMHGWVFYDDQHDVACGDTLACRMVQGPATAPLGSGSAELATPLATDGKALLLQGYQGTRLDSITDLHYATYRQSPDPGNNLAIALQINVDYDLTDQATGYQGRLVFEPYQGIGGNVPQQTWQTWDAKAGKWWGTKASVPVNGVLTPNPCVQATPCTWAQLLATFPNIGVHATYGAIVLKAGSNWAGFRGNVDALTVGAGGVTTTYDFELSERSLVPLTAPDSTPLEELTLTDTTRENGQLGGPVMRHIIVVVFRPGATQAERQSAIDSVQGIVVGGRRGEGGEGAYLVRVPTDGSVDALFRIIGRLNKLPQVMAAMLEEIFINGTTYLLPHDGPGLEESDWQLNADSSFGNTSRKTWALEAINGPWGWGCSTGGDTRVGVIDMGVRDTGEIMASVDTTSRQYPDGSFTHGTQVASVIAARGNDSTGMTGVMWHAKLDLHDVAAIDGSGGPVLNPLTHQPRSSEAAIITAINGAGTHGVRVVNVSLGGDPNLAQGAVHTSHQDQQRATWGHYAAELKLMREAIGQKGPLWVISAGNMHSGTDVYWAALSGVSDSVPDATIVVTGASGTRGRLSRDATGRGKIDIAAPGEDVTVADGTGVKTNSGSSFATPLVSGTAGLLFSFDSTLTAEQVRSFILTAATMSGRTAGGFPFLDAYGALKLAAQRLGAPLCGNRVVKSFDGIYAVRGIGVERIIPLGIQTPDSGNAAIDVYHGGRRIDIGWDREFEWKAGLGFVEQSPYTYPGDLLDGGTFLSGQATSHEYTVTGNLTFPIFDGPTGTDSVQLDVRSENATQRLTVAQTPVSRPTPFAAVGRVPDLAGGHEGLYVNTNWTYVGDWTEQRNLDGQPMAAMSPSGRYAIVAVNSGTTSVGADTNFTNCRPPDPSSGYAAQCAFGTVRSWSHHVDLYRVDFAAQSSRLIATFPGIEIAWIALTEREDEIVWQSVVRSDSSFVRWRFQDSPSPTYGTSVDSLLSHQSTCSGKRYEYHAFDRSPNATSPIGGLTTTSTSVMDGCDNPDHSYLGATVSPARIPSATSRRPLRLIGPGPHPPRS